MKFSKADILKKVWAHCYDCSGNDKREIKLCPCKKCALWEIRTRALVYPSKKSEEE